MAPRNARAHSRAGSHAEAGASTSSGTRSGIGSATGTGSGTSTSSGIDAGIDAGTGIDAGVGVGRKPVTSRSGQRSGPPGPAVRRSSSLHSRRLLGYAGTHRSSPSPL